MFQNTRKTGTPSFITASQYDYLAHMISPFFQILFLNEMKYKFQVLGVSF